MTAALLAGGVAVALLLVLLADFLKRKSAERKAKGVRESLTPTEENRGEASPFALEEAPSGAAPFYAVVDFQTTGLSVEEGAESGIIQAAWLILDKEFRVIKRRLSLVRQTERSSYEAQMVHHIPYEKIQEYGLPEQEVIRDLLLDLEASPVWVFHNAAFDLAILRGALRRCALTVSEDFRSRSVFCTMTFLPELSVGEKEEKYPSLISLAARLMGCNWPRHRFTRGLTAWRNVCLTRVCLRVLTERYPDRVAPHFDPVSHFLAS